MFLGDRIQILIVSPGHRHVAQAAIRLVDTQLGIETRIVRVRILTEKLRVDDALAEGTANRKRVTDNCPLTSNADQTDCRAPTAWCGWEVSRNPIPTLGPGRMV